MRIEDKGGALRVVVRGVPEFPAHLEAKAEAAALAGEAEDLRFLEWWREALRVRGYPFRARATGEERVQVRRLLGRHSGERLRVLAAEFLAGYGAENKDYPHMLRWFVAALPRVEEDLGS